MNPANQQIKDWFSVVPDRDGWERPKYAVYGKRKYRGKVRYIAGYSHSRLYAHFMTGSVTERILGYGDTQDEAIAMMRRKLMPAQEDNP